MPNALRVEKLQAAMQGLSGYVAFVHAYENRYYFVSLREQPTYREVARRCFKSTTAEHLSERILHAFPHVTLIAILREELPLSKNLQPELLAHTPVPLYSLSRSIALASAVPDEFCRFVLLDFHGGGAISLARRVDGAIDDFRTYVMSLGGMLGMPHLVEENRGDILSLLSNPETIAGRLAGLLRITDGFGYTSLALASTTFEDRERAGAMVRAIDGACESRHTYVALATDLAVCRGAVTAISSCQQPGLRASRSQGTTRFSMDVVRHLTYGVAQLSRHVFDPEEPALAALVGTRPLLFAVDEGIAHVYGSALHAYAARHLNLVGALTIRKGESNKSWDQVAAICTAAIDAGLPRHGVMIGVGGGVVLDIAGMAAALFRRGVSYVRIPTTLLGMIDAGLGIKHAVNFAHKKNIIGTFYPPLGVLTDPTFLRTVSRRDLACGIAEAIKIALVADSTLFCLLESHLETLLRTCFQAPAAVARAVLERSQIAMMNELAPNLFENDLKRAVDFGHSISPSLESRSHYTLAHGEAVAIDMLISTAIAIHMDLCPPSLFDRLVRMYRIAGLPLTDDLCTPQLLKEALSEVRAHRGGRLNLVVPNGVGSCTFLQHVDEHDCRIALDAVAEAGVGLTSSG